KAQLEELTRFKLIAEIDIKHTRVIAEKHHTWTCPVVKAQIALRFENLLTNPVTIKKMNLRVWERGEGGSARELPIRGEEPAILRHRPKLRLYDHSEIEIEIVG